MVAVSFLARLASLGAGEGQCFAAQSMERYAPANGWDFLHGRYYRCVGGLDRLLCALHLLWQHGVPYVVVEREVVVRIRYGFG